MNFNIITIFPDMIHDMFKYGVTGQAVGRGDVKLNTINPRTFTTDVHQSVDDRPFGGGDGMIMLAEPLKQAVESLGEQKGRVVLLSAHGQKWSDQKARDWAKDNRNITLICGRYGGVDQRFINSFVDEEISMGDFILSGGELGALAIMDSVIRLLPNVLGNSVSADAESFKDGLLEAPLFTRPQRFANFEVPEILRSGNHKKIAEFRRALALAITRKRRPDLLSDDHMNELDKALVALGEFSVSDLAACGLDKNELQGLVSG